MPEQSDSKYVSLPVTIEGKISTARIMVCSAAPFLFFIAMVLTNVITEHHEMSDGVWVTWVVVLGTLGVATSILLAFFSTRYTALVAEKFSSEK